MMESKVIFRLAFFLFSCLFGLFKSETNTCSIIINELQLAGNFSLNVTQEFIELSLDEKCSLPFDLSPYSLVLWRSNSDPKKMDLHSQARFSGSSCASLNKRFLVIGNVNPNSNPNSESQFCSFNDFGKDWIGGQHGYIDKGNSKTNALVLYRDVPADQLQVKVTMLNETTAKRENIVDLIFFAKTGGKGELIRQYLFPDYAVKTSNHSDASIYFRLKESDAGTITADQKHSFSFCCQQIRVEGKWPMGFKYSKPTPGSANNCEDLYEYCLDGAHGTYNASLDRCDVELITNYFKKEDKPATDEISSSTVTENSVTSDKPSSAVTECTVTETKTPSNVRHKSSVARSLGMGLGIGLSIACVLILVLVAIVYRRRKQEENHTRLIQSYA